VIVAVKYNGLSSVIGTMKHCVGDHHVRSAAIVGARCSQPLLSAICYVFPSQATFEGIMALSIGSGTNIIRGGGNMGN